MARVLILSLVFPPDGVSTAQLMGELAVDLRRAGHSVTAITTTPHYNRDVVAEERQPIRRRWGGLFGRSRFEGIEVLHVAMPRKGASIALRLLAWMWFHLLSTILAWTAVGRPDVVIAPSPPLTIGVGAWLAGLGRRVPFIYNVQEVYPDIAVRTGVLRSPLLIRALRALEDFVYRRACSITVISEGMRENLLAKGVPPRKVRLVPNFVDVDEIAPAPKDNAFAREHGLHDRFVVSYAGNMGPMQGLDVLLDAADRLREHEDVVFLLVGGGSDRERLAARAASMRLDNVLFLGHQPYASVPLIYGASDLCVVPQLDEIGTDAAPSKVYRIMSAARPVLGIAREGSDLDRLVSTSGAGVVVAKREPDVLARAILEARDAPGRLAAMGEAGRRHVVEHFSRERVTRQYDELIAEAGAPAPPSGGELRSASRPS